VHDGGGGDGFGGSWSGQADVAAARRRKRDAVLRLLLRLLRGEDLETVSRSLGITAATPTSWRDAFLAAGEASLATRPADGEEPESGRLKARLGEMLLEQEPPEAKIAALEEGRPSARRRSRPWAAPFPPAPAGLTASPGCAGFGGRRAPPSTGRHRAPPRAVPPRRPGPVGPMPDAALAEAIRAVLAASSFHGEGHRKVWARLRHAGVRTSKRRVLRASASMPPGTRTASRPSIRCARACAAASARSARTSPAASRSATTTARSTWPTTSGGSCASSASPARPPSHRAPEGNGCAERSIRTLEENLLL
jgi:hypothetical protein